MSPEEYAAMYQQVYGCSAFENNSYLYFEEEEVPESVDHSTVNKYRDFEGAIRFMDNEYLVQDAFASYPDNDVASFTVIGNLDDDEMGFDAPDFVHGFPAPVQYASYHQETVLAGPVIDFQVKPFDKPTKTMNTDQIRHCPCFNLQFYTGVDPILASAHSCEDCEWCTYVPPVKFSQFLALSGGTVYFSHPREILTSYPKKRIKDNAYAFVPFSLCGVPIIRKMASKRTLPLSLVFDRQNIFLQPLRDIDKFSTPLLAFERCCSTKHPPAYHETGSHAHETATRTLALRASETPPASTTDNSRSPDLVANGIH
jgi:hypothetical protein